MTATRVSASVALVMLVCIGAQVFAAGQYADPAISNATISIGGTNAAHINDENDCVFLSASANDQDGENAPPGDRIDLEATQWSIPDGFGHLEDETGPTNLWKAPTFGGTTKVTVTFHDKDDGYDYDDDPKEVQHDLISFKVGIQMSVDGGPPVQVWEGEAGPASAELQGRLQVAEQEVAADDSNPQPAEKTASLGELCTWTLITDPPGVTTMSGNIQGRVQAYSIQPSFIQAAARDTDLNDGGQNDLVVSFPLGGVTIGFPVWLASDDYVALAAIGVGFNSKFGVTFVREIEKVSSAGIYSPTTIEAVYDTGEKGVLGKAGETAWAAWSLGYRVSAKAVGDDNESCAAKVSGDLQCRWKITQRPVYIP